MEFKGQKSATVCGKCFGDMGRDKKRAKRPAEATA